MFYAMTTEDIQGAKSVEGVPMTTWARLLEQFAKSTEQELVVYLHHHTSWSRAYASLFSANRIDDGAVIVPVQVRYRDDDHAAIITKKGNQSATPSNQD